MIQEHLRDGDMKQINYNNQEIIYLKNSTAASISFGSNSSACEDNIAFGLKSIPVNVELILEPMKEQLNDYATIDKVDRDRIKKTYPKPSIAKAPAIGQDLDIL